MKLLAFTLLLAVVLPAAATAEGSPLLTRSDRAPRRAAGAGDVHEGSQAIGLTSEQRDASQEGLIQEAQSGFIDP